MSGYEEREKANCRERLYEGCQKVGKKENLELIEQLLVLMLRDEDEVYPMYVTEYMMLDAIRNIFDKNKMEVRRLANIWAKTFDE